MSYDFVRLAGRVTMFRNAIFVLFLALTVFAPAFAALADRTQP